MFDCSLGVQGDKVERGPGCWTRRIKLDLCEVRFLQKKRRKETMMLDETKQMGSLRGTIPYRKIGRRAQHSSEFAPNAQKDSFEACFGTNKPNGVSSERKKSKNGEEPVASASISVLIKERRGSVD